MRIRGGVGSITVEIDGANERTYMPPSSTAGETEYCVSITNTNLAVNGHQFAHIQTNTAKVTVTEDIVDAQTPIIDVHP